MREDKAAARRELAARLLASVDADSAALQRLGILEAKQVDDVVYRPTRQELELRMLELGRDPGADSYFDDMNRILGQLYGRRYTVEWRQMLMAPGVGERTAGAAMDAAVRTSRRYLHAQCERELVRLALDGALPATPMIFSIRQACAAAAALAD